MRQWHVAPSLLCDQHLLGEHVEHHMFVGSIRKGVSLAGYLSGGLVEPATLKDRHDALAAEMERRGMRHASPLQPFEWSGDEGLVDRAGSYKELLGRCGRCRSRLARAAVRGGASCEQRI